MGIHLCVDEFEPKEWDGLRYGYDDEFLNKIWHNNDLKLVISKTISEYDCEYEHRPKDLILFRKMIIEWDIDDNNKERYLHLCDLFEKSDTSGMQVSY